MTTILQTRFDFISFDPEDLFGTSICAQESSVLNFPVYEYLFWEHFDTNFSRKYVKSFHSCSNLVTYDWKSVDIMECYQSFIRIKTICSIGIVSKSIKNFLENVFRLNAELRNRLKVNLTTVDAFYGVKYFCNDYMQSTLEDLIEDYSFQLHHEVDQDNVDYVFIGKLAELLGIYRKEHRFLMARNEHANNRKSIENLCN